MHVRVCMRSGVDTVGALQRTVRYTTLPPVCANNTSGVPNPGF